MTSLKKSINPSYCSALKLASKFASSDKLNLTPLLGGVSSACLFHFEVASNSYVLRLLPEQASLEEKDRQITLMKNAAKAGIGPSIHYTCPNSSGVIMDFIDGKTVTPKLFIEKNYLINFAKTLKKLHDSPIVFPIAISPFVRFANFIKNLKKPYSQKIHKAIASMQKIEESLSTSQVHFKPSHLNLHSLNIMLENNRFFLLDWVNGGMSDPFFDLATASLFLNLNKKQIKIFLKTYFNKDPSQYQLDRFYIVQPVRLFVIFASMLGKNQPARSMIPLKMSFTEFLEKHCTNTLNHSTDDIGYTMLHKALDLVSQKRFVESIDRFPLY